MTRRTIVRTGVRVAVGVVALAVGAGVVAAATALPIPRLADRPAARVVTPVALDQQRVCQGSLLRLSGDTGASATTLSAVGSAATVTGAGSGDRPVRTPLAGADGTQSSPLLVTAPAAGTRIPLVAGSQSQKASETDLRGFAAAPCQEPTNSTWLVGGSTQTGRTTLISLVNPTAVNSTVDLSVWAENGAVKGPGLQGIVVAPKSQKVVPLSGFATDLASPVVHVTSRGGQIVSSLQVSVVRTLQAGGADLVSASAAPAKRVTVPGVVVRDTDRVAAAAGQDGFADLAPVVRVFVPGSANARLSIQLSTTSGTGATFSVSAQGGQVTDLPLDDLAAADYTATIDSNVPVVAGVRTSSVATDGTTDLAWTGGAPALSGTTMFTAATGPSGLLTVTNPTNRAIAATYRLAEGPGYRAVATKLTVPANASVSSPLRSRGVYSLSGADGLRAAVSYEASGAIAAYPLFSPTAVSSPVTVYP